MASPKREKRIQTPSPRPVAEELERLEAIEETVTESSLSS
ncbi:hypothetical protein PC116_g3618 [Phytophthora cactorum]|uniref:Uncharacterized protein n=1 Tax=Phytophthora cactorum TaxID=29920 RepID=A0A8T1GG84_9STRA|nr:hypothetical protein PC111_g2565 [Phytophthora cactorum]KAG2846022.1 hypothetical protein PC112_g1620 [Phytophthora cactorum]KAG2867504.1 hypothetical protein PC113_g1913 [Phytophthora cactorum]KAG2931936.1 hypothetical protein PC114_g1988 [Phytophthora cactorum]KAG2936866.1 hypothetical protein PC115_g4513 [Phytophthora cactorum]